MLRLVRLVAEEPGVHGFVLRATADCGVVDEARALTRALLQGQELPALCQQLCQRFGVAESLLLDRVWAVSSLASGGAAADLGPYEVLGVDPWADQDTIKSAYRQLCRQCHPDLNPGDPEAARRFLQIKAAYDMVAGNSGTAGWTPPAESSVWEECPARDAVPSTWMRMRSLFPLALVVILLVMAVGFADILMLRPKPRTQAREAAMPRQAESPQESPLADGGESGRLPAANAPVPAPSSAQRPTAPPVSTSVTAGADAAPAARDAANASGHGMRQVLADAGAATLAPLETPAPHEDGGKGADAVHVSRTVVHPSRTSASKDSPITSNASDVVGQAAGPLAETARNGGGGAHDGVQGSGEGSRVVRGAVPGRSQGGHGSSVRDQIAEEGEATMVAAATVHPAVPPKASPESQEPTKGRPARKNADASRSAGDMTPPRNPRPDASSAGHLSGTPVSDKPVPDRSVPEKSVVGAPVPDKSVPDKAAPDTSVHGAPVAGGSDAGQTRARSLEPGAVADGPAAMAGKVASGAQTARAGKEGTDLVAGAEGYVHLSDVMSRMERFLATYTHDYSQRDLRAFLAHFTPQARENGTPVSELGPGYEETFKAVPIMRYSIDVDRWTMRSEGISVQGRFEMRGAYADGRILSSGGKLEMELVPSGDTYRIRNLAYTFR